MVKFNPKVYIGIDPGKSGGIAWCIDGKYNAIKMPETTKDLYDFLSHYPRATTMIEKVGASPQIGKVAGVSFGRNIGEIHMGCIASGHHIQYISPVKWQRPLGLIQKGMKFGEKQKKVINKQKAQELFPGIKITHAIADALLICYVCYKKSLNHELNN